MSDGSYYEGEFDRGEINGHGLRYFATTGNFYCGEFSAGELNGEGVMTYADGSTYEGAWAHNRREGLLHFEQTCYLYTSESITHSAFFVKEYFPVRIF